MLTQFHEINLKQDFLCEQFSFWAYFDQLTIFLFCLIGTRYPNQQHYFFPTGRRSWRRRRLICSISKHLWEYQGQTSRDIGPLESKNRSISSGCRSDSNYIQASQADKTDDRISILNRSQAGLQKTKAHLVARRYVLLHELNQVNLEIADIDKNLSPIPTSISKLEQEKEFLRQAHQLQRNIQPILGFADEDQKEINKVDASTINVIQSLLGSV